MRTFKIYCPQISNMLYNIIYRGHQAVLYIPATNYSFYKWSLYLLTSFIRFAQPPSPCPWEPPVYSLYLWTWCSVFLFCFVKDSTNKWDHTVSGLSLTYFSLHNAKSEGIHVVTNGKISFFLYSWVIFQCIYIPHVLYRSSYPWTLRLQLRLRLCVGYCK